MRRAAVAALALLAWTAGASRAPAALEAWTVEGEETREGVPIVLATDLRIAPGGTLRLLGVDLLVAPAQRPLTILVMAGGALELAEGAPPGGAARRGTSVAGLGVPFDVVVQPGGRLLATNATLADARLDLGGDARLVNARLSLAAGPLRVTGGETTLEGGEAEGSPDSLLVVERGSLRAQGVRLAGAGATAVRALAGAALALSDSTILGAGGYGVHGAGADVTLERVAFEATADYGVLAEGGRLTLRGSALDAHCGAFLTAGATGVVEDNVLRGRGHGITLRNAVEVLVARNDVENADTALYALGSTGRVAGNALRGNGEAMFLADADLAVDGNALEGNAAGILVQAGPRLPVLRNNSLDGTASLLRNLAGGTVDARWNWWGGAAGPSAGAVTGDVAVSPWLVAPP